VRTFESLDEFAAAANSELGISDWLTIDQKRIDAFADATDDHQWIHCDPEAAARGPFGATIAHGLLTLSLLPMLISRVYAVRGTRMAVNYGFNRVRFPTPIPVDSPVRLSLALGDVTRTDGAVQALLPGLVEIKGVAKPACAFEAITRYPI